MSDTTVRQHGARPALSARTRAAVLIGAAVLALGSGVVILAAIVDEGVLGQVPTAVLLSVLGVFVLPGVMVGVEIASRRGFAQIQDEGAIAQESSQGVRASVRHGSHERAARAHGATRPGPTERSREQVDAA